MPEHLAAAEVVFVGEVTKLVETKNPESGFSEGKTATLKVTEKIKGISVNEITIDGGGDPAMCGVNFEQGKRYVVFATEFEGKLGTSNCSGTFEYPVDVNSELYTSAVKSYQEIKTAPTTSAPVAVTAQSNAALPVIGLAVAVLAGVVVMYFATKRRPE
jgi:hypothetical protein